MSEPIQLSFEEELLAKILGEGKVEDEVEDDAYTVASDTYADPEEEPRTVATDSFTTHSPPSRTSTMSFKDKMELDEDSDLLLAEKEQQLKKQAERARSEKLRYEYDAAMPYRQLEHDVRRKARRRLPGTDNKSLSFEDRRFTKRQHFHEALLSVKQDWTNQGIWNEREWKLYCCTNREDFLEHAKEWKWTFDATQEAKRARVAAETEEFKTGQTYHHKDADRNLVSDVGHVVDRALARVTDVSGRILPFLRLRSSKEVEALQEELNVFRKEMEFSMCALQIGRNRAVLGQRERAREGSRPLARFCWQIQEEVENIRTELERKEIERRTKKKRGETAKTKVVVDVDDDDEGDGDGSTKRSRVLILGPNEENEIYKEAENRVAQDWFQRHLWDDKWGSIPGLLWRHERVTWEEFRDERLEEMAKEDEQRKKQYEQEESERKEQRERQGEQPKASCGIPVPSIEVDPLASDLADANEEADQMVAEHHKTTILPSPPVSNNGFESDIHNNDSSLPSPYDGTVYLGCGNNCIVQKSMFARNAAKLQPPPPPPRQIRVCRVQKTRKRKQRSQ